MLSLINKLKTPSNIFVLLGVSLLFFDLQYYLMVSLPGSKGLQCILGANLTALNLGFSVLLSLLGGLMFVAFLELYRSKKRSISAGGASGFALLIGMLTVFCTACTLPVISLFGISLSLLFFTEHEVWLKGVSIFLMLLSLLILNKQLKDDGR